MQSERVYVGDTCTLKVPTRREAVTCNLKLR